jgi:hypothetical protein
MLAETRKAVITDSTSRVNMMEASQRLIGTTSLNTMRPLCFDTRVLCFLTRQISALHHILIVILLSI